MIGYVLTANYTVKVVNGAQHPTKPDHIQVGGKKWHKSDVYPTAEEAIAAGRDACKRAEIALKNRLIELNRRKANLAASATRLGV